MTLLGTHHRPNDRPLHPRCAKLLDREFQCTCDREWEGWDGTDDGLDRSITLNKRLEYRTKWGCASIPVPHDADDAPDATAEDAMRSDYTQAVTSFGGGFWKESENLKTLRGGARWEDLPYDAHCQQMDKLRLHIIDRGYWGDCSGAELDAMRARVDSYEGN